jgi:hypothetical protein
MDRERIEMIFLPLALVDSHREDRVAERLMKMAQTSHEGYITASDVTIELHTSFPLAWEYLKVSPDLHRAMCDSFLKVGMC